MREFNKRKIQSKQITISNLIYIIINIITTLFRFFPFPSKTGLFKIGNPTRKSPVILTCNYRLTLERVKKALRGLDCYLLVANSKGINVWCAATGGLFTNHNIISVLKTSGIEEFVDHREITLPQLAATGVEANVIHQKTGWKVIWGPVYAKDIPNFIEGNLKKANEMYKVKFPLTQRIEMAVAWAFTISIILSLLMLPFWQEIILPFVVFVWSLALLIFITFPLYERMLISNRQETGFRFEQGGFQLILWSAIIFLLFIYQIVIAGFSWGFIFRWGLIALIIILILTLDLMGSTPVYKSSTHEDRFLTIHIDKIKCKGVGVCVQVCPRDCFEVDQIRHTTVIPRLNRCVQCGACIVQCPFDALYFKNKVGETISPDIIRRFKLNLMGKRLVKI